MRKEFGQNDSGNLFRHIFHQRFGVVVQLFLIAPRFRAPSEPDSGSEVPWDQQRVTSLEGAYYTNRALRYQKSALSSTKGVGIRGRPLTQTEGSLRPVKGLGIDRCPMKLTVGPLRQTNRDSSDSFPRPPPKERHVPGEGLRRPTEDPPRTTDDTMTSSMALWGQHELKSLGQRKLLNCLAGPANRWVADCTAWMMSPLKGPFYFLACRKIYLHP